MYSVIEANKYLKNKKVENNSFRPKFHFAPEFGWVNDPHGIVKFKGKYHIYFQYYPFDTTNPETCWGHTSTKDFIHFDKTKCVITPDKEYDKLGCWSGSVIVKNGLVFLFYTGFTKNNNDEYRQTICLAVSDDGINFEKYGENPLIDEKLIPHQASKVDFRDPCIFEKGGTYYLLVGSKNEMDKKAFLLLYRSKDLIHFEFDHIVLEEENFGTMFECPNILQFKTQDFIILSPQNVLPKKDSFFNVSSNVYFNTNKVLEKQAINLKRVREIDHGLEFYATNVSDKNKIAVSWLQMWGRRYYLHEIKEDFINSFSLFKKVKRSYNQLKFIPLKNYNKYLKNEVSFAGFIDENKTFEAKIGRCTKLKIELFDIKNKTINIKLLKNEDEFALLSIDGNSKRIILDRRKLKEQLYGVDPSSSKEGYRYINIDKNLNNIELNIYIDNYIVEAFLNDYKDSLSFLAFSRGEDIVIESKDHIEYKIEKYDVVI